MPSIFPIPKYMMLDLFSFLAKVIPSVSDDHIVCDQYLILADVNHYELNNQIKSQKVQALEHDSHIIPCTFD
jgi:hypothetical protein